MAERRAPSIVALVGLVQAACTGDVDGGVAKGALATASAPAVSVSAPLSAEVRPESADDLDGGTLGGLEFDPSSRRLIMPDGPPRPRPLRPGDTLATDTLMREEQLGVTMTATFRPRDVAEAPKAPELNAAGISAAKKLTEPTITITATAFGRAKMVFQSRALPLPFRSEIRSRFDRLGHLVFWPGLSRYRVVAPGALRTTLGERRVDVTPLVPGSRTKVSAGKVLDLPTRSTTLESSLARIRLESAVVPEAGLGGPLFCRALVEIAGIDPVTNECKPEEVVLTAAVDWIDGGGFEIEVTSLERRSDLPPSEVLVPPPGAAGSQDGLPESPDGVYLTKDELAAFRSKPVDKTPGPGAPAEGLLAENGRDFLMILYLDGVPVAGVPALAQRYLIGPQKGQYTAQWRTFLGEHVEPPTTIDVPSVVRSVTTPNGADAGRP